MKTVVLIIIVVLIGIYAMKSLCKSFSGKGGCSCGTGKKSSDCGGCSSYKDEDKL